MCFNENYAMAHLRNDQIKSACPLVSEDSSYVSPGLLLKYTVCVNINIGKLMNSVKQIRDNSKQLPNFTSLTINYARDEHDIN
jgi:hypothetical protein